MTLNVVQMGHFALRQKAHIVSDIFDPNIQSFIDDMIDTLHQQNGIGLAAPQVGSSHQICIVAPNQRCKPPYDTIESGLVLINPKVTFLTKKITNEWEGCLSIPGIRGLVPRQCHIRVEYTNRYGELKSEIYSDFTARIFLHEIDHLNGILFVDRLKDITKDLITDHVYADMTGSEE